MIPWDADELTLEEPGGEGMEAFLAGSVPDLHFDSAVANRHHLHLKVDGDSRDVVHREILVLKTLEETRLADAAFPDNNDLDQDVVVRCLHL
jgi:hypothetical protein